MNQPKRVSVVIPTKDGAATLPDLMDALFAAEVSFDVEVLAVDSGSTDGTLSILERHPVNLHRIPPEEFDHGGTRNLGIRLSSGDPVVLLTQDALPASPDFLEAIVQPFRDSRVAGVYGRQIPRSDCDVVTRRQLQTWLTGRESPALAQLAGRSLAAMDPADRHRLCVFDNVCSAVRRADWEKIPFRRTAFGEDIEWGMRAIEAGRAIAYEPRAAVVHSHRRSVLYEYRRTRLCHARLRELFGLETLPRRRDVLRASLANLRSDLPYVQRNAPRGVERLRQLTRVACLSILSPLAQHQGIHDARRTARPDPCASST